MTNYDTPDHTHIRRLCRSYYTITGLHWLAVALPLAVFVRFLQARGLNLWHVGMMMGLYSLTIVLFELPTGGLADALGRKPVFVLASISTLMTTALFLLASSPLWFASAFVLMGVSRALDSGALSAWFVDSLLEQDDSINLQPYLAGSDIAQTCGLCLGTLVGGMLPSIFARHAHAWGVTPLVLPFVAAFIMKLVTLSVVLRAVNESRPAVTWHRVRRQANVMPLLRAALAHIQQSSLLPLILASSLLSMMALTSIETFWQPRFAAWLAAGSAAEHPSDSAILAVLMTAAFASGIVGNVVALRVARWLETFMHREQAHGVLAGISQAMTGGIVLALAVQSHVMGGALFFCLYYLTSALQGSFVLALFHHAVPAAQRSSLQSVLSLAGHLGGVVGGVVFGYVAQQHTIAVAWWWAGAVLVASTGLFVLMSKRLSMAKTPLLSSR